MMRLRYLLFVLLAFAAVGCHTQMTVVNDVTEREANEIVVLLASRGLDAKKVEVVASTTGGAQKEQMYNITVPSGQVTESLSILNQAGLPRMKGTTLLDLFGAKGLVPSDLQDRIRYQEGLSDQLSTTIRKMDGIIDADVQITFPQEENGPQEMTASVYVKHRGILDNPNSLTITKIKRLVSSALPGLKIDNVSVVADRAVYADISLEPTSTLIQDKQYVSIWGVTVAKDSAPLFRTIFYLFFFCLFILLCAIAWILWKFYPIIERLGGPGHLLTPQQYSTNPSENGEFSPDENNEKRK